MGILLGLELPYSYPFIIGPKLEKKIVPTPLVQPELVKIGNLVFTKLRKKLSMDFCQIWLILKNKMVARTSLDYFFDFHHNIFVRICQNRIKNFDQLKLPILTNSG